VLCRVLRGSLAPFSPIAINRTAGGRRIGEHLLLTTLRADGPALFAIGWLYAPVMNTHMTLLPSFLPHSDGIAVCFNGIKRGWAFFDLPVVLQSRTEMPEDRRLTDHRPHNASPDCHSDDGLARLVLESQKEKTDENILSRLPRA
jgi:hypothetical protein